MKVSLVVATGVHQGKAISLPGPQFLIGRDPECHLRPASPAVSKRHCLIHVRDGRVFVSDLGSTNGSFLNDTQLVEEAEARPGDRLRVGPLDFRVQFTPSDSKADATPLPEALRSVALGAKPAPAAVQPGTPMPMPKSTTPPKPTPPAAKEPVAAPKAAAPQPAARQNTSIPKAGSSADDIAAAMMAEDDDGVVSVPEGSTVMELPAVDAERLRMAGQDPAKPADAKKVPTAADTSNAASEILRKYMKRPK